MSVQPNPKLGIDPESGAFSLDNLVTQLEAAQKALEAKVAEEQKEVAGFENQKEGLLDRIKQITHLKQQKDEEVAKINTEIIELIELKEEKERELTEHEGKALQFQSKLAELGTQQTEELAKRFGNRALIKK